MRRDRRGDAERVGQALGHSPCVVAIRIRTHVDAIKPAHLAHLFEKNHVEMKDLVFVGHHEAGWVHALGTKCVSAVMGLFTRPPFPVVGDGLVTVAVGRKA